MTRMPRRVRNLSRSGFTLLEVLTALALSVLLIAAIYSGLDLCYRYSETGREEVERAQVARAVLRQIERDLRGVLYHPPSETSSSSSATSTSSTSESGSGTAGSTSSSTGATEIAATEDAGVAAASGLFGNSNTLMLHVSHPMREQAFGLVDTAHIQSRGSDLLTVAYFVGGTGTGSLQSLVKTPGLLRMQGERLALSLADQQSNLNTLAAAAQSLAPEVIAIEFQYFDGFNWRSNWDSTVFSGLPRAIKVAIELSPPAEGPNRKSAASETLKLTTVVSLPLGQPIDTSAIAQ